MNRMKLWWLDFLVKIDAKKRLKRQLQLFTFPHKDDLCLFATKHTDVIVKTYADVSVLTPSEDFLLKVFDLPSATDILQKYVKTHRLPLSVELKLFEKASEMGVVINTAISYRHLSDNAVYKLFDLPDGEKKVCLYLDVSSGHIPEAFQLKLFELPNSVEAVKTFAQRRSFCVEAQRKMFEQPNAGELVCAYLDYRELSNEVLPLVVDLPNFAEVINKAHFYGLNKDGELKLVQMPNAGNLIRLYTSDYNLCPEAEAKLLARDDISEIIEDYLKVSDLAEENTHLLLQLPDGAKHLQLYLLQGNTINDKTVEEIFANPAFEETLLILLQMQSQNISPKMQCRLFKQPNAAKLLSLYITEHQLCEEAQFKLLSLPLPQKARLLKQYAAKHIFSRQVMQYITVNNYLR